MAVDGNAADAAVAIDLIALAFRSGGLQCPNRTNGHSPRSGQRRNGLEASIFAGCCEGAVVPPRYGSVDTRCTDFFGRNETCANDVIFVRQGQAMHSGYSSTSTRRL
jgi:hypothetical protein